MGRLHQNWVLLPTLQRRSRGTQKVAFYIGETQLTQSVWAPESMSVDAPARVDNGELMATFKKMIGADDLLVLVEIVELNGFIEALVSHMHDSHNDGKDIKVRNGRKSMHGPTAAHLAGHRWGAYYTVFDILQ